MYKFSQYLILPNAACAAHYKLPSSFTNRKSKFLYGQVDPPYGRIKEYVELEGEELIGSGDMGTWGTANMQLSRGGTQLKREVTSIHLRRYIIIKMCQHPKFFSKYLCKSLATHYGLDRISAK